MGYVVLHSIVVSSWDEQAVNDARGYAVGLFGDLVTLAILSEVNGYNTFYVSPDGSKAGWETSNEYNEKRKQYCNWLAGQDRLIWAHVSIGEDGEVSLVKEEE